MAGVKSPPTGDDEKPEQQQQQQLCSLLRLGEKEKSLRKERRKTAREKRGRERSVIIARFDGFLHHFQKPAQDVHDLHGSINLFSPFFCFLLALIGQKCRRRLASPRAKKRAARYIYRRGYCMTESGL